jgi:glycosyltransferase involved in cell wall biosynthesis
VSTPGAGGAPALRGRSIVCVGFADWGEALWTNQQHLMSRLARDNRVLFVESLGLRRPTLAGRDVRRLLRRGRRGLSGPRPADGLHVLSPLVLPFHGAAAVRALNGRLLRALVRRALHRLSLEGDVLWAYVPQAEVLLETLRPRIVVYHCVDDIAVQKGIDTASFRAAEERFARRADLVLASSPPLAERMRRLSANVLYAPNVADHAMFARALDRGREDPGMAALPHPRLVFTGAVAEKKLDFGLLARMARLRPRWSIALVGPVGEGDPYTDVSALEALPNLHVLGPRAHERLPEVLRAADVGLIPYAVNDLTRSVFPMKVYEYLAAGLPVVSTPLPSLDGVEAVLRADRPEGIVELVETELAAASEAARRARSAVAEAHSWDARLAEIAEAVRAVEDAR